MSADSSPSQEISKKPARQTIAVGVGNSSVQIGRFSLGKPVGPLPEPLARDVFPSRADDGGPNLNWDELKKIAAAAEDVGRLPTSWHIASVFGEAADAVADWVAKHCPGASVTLMRNEDFPIEIATESPERVGTDRIAAATAAARLKSPDRAAIFVDAGTALTVNAVSAKGVFLGGAILPGTTTSGDALNKSTDQLPRIVVLANKPPPQPIGRATNSAIASGIYWGSVGAVKELIARMSEELQESGDSSSAPEIFVTGGFGPALTKHLGGEARSLPNLVLSGIVLASLSQPKRT